MTDNNSDSIGALIELAERCEAATGPNYDLEVDIAFGIAGQKRPPKNDIYMRVAPPPIYTASIDAAMTLVPKGCHLQHFGDTDLDNPDAQKWTAAIRARESDDLSWDGEARVWCATGPLALCAAALRAIAQTKGSQ